MLPAAHPADRIAASFEPSGRTLTYGELDQAANRVWRLLRSAGLERGDHVAFLIENAPAFFEIAWGSRYAGARFTAISTSLKADEISYIIGDCDARIAFISARYADRAAEVKAACPKVERWFAVGGGIDGFESYEDLLEAESGEPLDEERLAGSDMLYSSGTTGRPKGILPTRDPDPITEPTPVTQILVGMMGANADDVYISPAPLYHAAPLRFCMSIHQLGAETVVMEKWDAGHCLELIDRKQVTIGQFVPTMFIRLLRLPDGPRQAADVSSLRSIVHAAAPCPVDVKQQMIDWWGPIIHEYYAGTEGVGLTWITPTDWLERPGTVGKALIGIPHILDESGQEVGAGTDGAIFFSDGYSFEYHKDPAKTADNTDSRGWQTFGDIGHLDADGFLYLTDRASYMIITGGVNVYPQEAEDALQSHPAVLDAAVFGIPHAEMGEQVKAVVQPVDLPADADAAAALEQELIDYCRSRLSNIKCPRSIDFRPELPRTPTGKLLKRILKDEYQQHV